MKFSLYVPFDLKVVVDDSISSVHLSFLIDQQKVVLAAGAAAHRHPVFCLCRIPKLGGNDLDLHLLYKEVTSRGGLEQVFLLVTPIFAGYSHM